MTHQILVGLFQGRLQPNSQKTIPCSKLPLHKIETVQTTDKIVSQEILFVRLLVYAKLCTGIPQLTLLMWGHKKIAEAKPA